MFGINNDKLVERINTVVLPGMLSQEPESLVKYNLALKYLIDMSSFKKIICASGVIAGALTAICCSSTYITAAGLTGIIAGGIGFRKADAKIKEYRKLFRLILVGMKVVHLLSDEEMVRLLDNISADDLVDFLVKENLTERGV